MRLCVTFPNITTLLGLYNSAVGARVLLLPIAMRGYSGIPVPVLTSPATLPSNYTMSVV